MPNTTTRLALQEPLATDAPSALRTALTNHATTLDNSAIYQEGTLAARPNAGTVAHGTFYRSTDTGDLSYSNGAAWISVAGASRGATSIGGAPQSTSSAVYTTLGTADQVTGIVLPVNGLIRVWFQALWQESVVGSARAAIFIGTNQLNAQGFDGATHGSLPQSAATNNTTAAAVNLPLATFGGGLASFGAGTAASFGADVTTGQIVGASFAQVVTATNGTVNAETGSVGRGGACDIFATTGTYTISVRFRVNSGGTVTASNRKLWVEAKSFS